jgi:hypothetical protein
VISLILGILSFIGIPLVGGVGAVICGHMARRQIRETGEQGDGLAVGGLVMGYIHLALFGLAIVVIGLFFAFGIGAAILSR